MSRASTQAQQERLAPLLFAPCTCSMTPRLVCVACARWAKQYRTVTERRRAWRARR